VFERSAKSIELSPEIMRRFDIDEAQITPAELISYLLRSRIDLLWNGGIGTYVKASDEAHTDVGDKANDGLRVDGADLRCRVVGEGGNLGLTQLGRVNSASAGGPVAITDFIRQCRRCRLLGSRGQYKNTCWTLSLRAEN